MNIFLLNRLQPLFIWSLVALSAGTASSVGNWPSFRGNQASGVADGRIYLSGEDGDIFVVKAGKDFELLSTNPMGERLMATPALSDGTMYVRAEHSIFAIGR